MGKNLGFHFEIPQPPKGPLVEMSAEEMKTFKNLGIALTGQEDYAGAARCFVAAPQANAADPRAFHLLLDLLRDHPELEFEFREAADSCKRAVEVVRHKAAQLKPAIYRGWRKHLILLRMKVRSFCRRWRRIPNQGKESPDRQNTPAN
jgi:hypothetical protein